MLSEPKLLAQLAAVCKRSVDLPIPGSPPSKIAEHLVADGRPDGGILEVAQSDGHILADRLRRDGAGVAGTRGLVEDVERVILGNAHGARVQDAGETQDGAALVGISDNRLPRITVESGIRLGPVAQTHEMERLDVFLGELVFVTLGKAGDVKMDESFRLGNLGCAQGQCAMQLIVVVSPVSP